LYFSYVGLLQKHHTQAALAYAATDREGQFAFEESLVEIKFLAVFLAFKG
jgi:hypothetical protein